MGLAFSSTLRTTPEAWEKYGLSWLVSWLQGWAWIGAPAAFLLLPAVGATRRFVGSPWVWECLKLALDELKREVFHGSNGADHHHKVTLFKLRLGGRLVPVLRSGVTRQSTPAVFLAHADNPDHAEGVAGRTFARQNIVEIQGLPDLSAPNTTDKDREAYAERTSVSVQWLAKNPDSTKARSFVGFHIERKSKPWGVLVIDSRDPNPFKQTKKLEKSIRSCARLTGKLLEKTW